MAVLTAGGSPALTRRADLVSAHLRQAEAGGRERVGCFREDLDLGHRKSPRGLWLLSRGMDRRPPRADRDPPRCDAMVPAFSAGRYNSVSRTKPCWTLPDQAHPLLGLRQIVQIELREQTPKKMTLTDSTLKTNSPAISRMEAGRVKADRCLYGRHKVTSTLRCRRRHRTGALCTHDHDPRPLWRGITKAHLGLLETKLIRVIQDPVPVDPLAVEKRPVAGEAPVVDRPRPTAALQPGMEASRPVYPQPRQTSHPSSRPTLTSSRAGSRTRIR